MRVGAWSVILSALAAVFAFAAEIPRITGDEGATFDDLIREQRLVTVILNSGAADRNLTITGVHSDAGTISVKDITGAPTAYPFALVREVRVQKERIRTEDKPDPETVLTADDKLIVTAASDRALDIFRESHLQPIRMAAANVLAASDNEKKADALSYLKELSVSNDAAIAMQAAGYLWQNGQEIPDAVMLAGFNSGNRGAKATAAHLAGLMKADKFVIELRRLLADPSVEIFPYAARALGRLGDQQSLAELLESLESITDAKAEAAVFALVEMGGPEVSRRLETMLSTAQTIQRFRILRALYKMGNEEAKALLTSDALKQPAFQRMAALILAEDGDPEALKFLREYLTRPMDPNPDNLIFRAAAGVALYLGGDIQAKGIIGDMLNVQPGDIYARGRADDQKFKEEAVRTVQVAVCTMIGNQMRRDLLPLLAGPIQSADPVVALAACRSAMQIGNREFGQRVKAYAL